MRKFVFWLLLALPVCSQPKALVVISIDGLANRYLNEADALHLKIPTLRRLMAGGAHATGVRNVMPTVTYPNHTTLLTGVNPATHGIANNTTFDPLEKNLGGWYWYAEDIRVPTLWEVASKAGYKVGSVSWPVSAGASARGVSELIPEYWRASTADDLKLLRALSTPGLLAELQPTAGEYTTNLNDAIRGDHGRTRYSVGIIKQKHARFMTIHLAALDHLEHESGPYTGEAFAALEEIDGMVAEIESAMRSETPDTVMCIVSDHGFAPTAHQLDLRAAFVKAGLLSGAAWQASPWGSGGSSFVVLRDPRDAAVRAKVSALLKALAADPANGIDHILDRGEIAALGGTSAADFAVDMKPGYAIGSGAESKGQHGFSPVHPEMRASFVIAGPGIGKGITLGEIDMRSIAPTLAKLLGSSLPSAEKAALDVFNTR